MKLILWIPLLLITFISCDKFDEESVLTNGEKISLELQKMTQQEDINTATVFVYYSSYSVVKDSKPFSFSKQFIIVDGTYYNLNNLLSYEINSHTFFLYFK
nr:hypothetical protein [uncultured Carboxylicivirga sp.]